MSEIHALFIIGFIAVLAPLIARLSAFILMPAVVLELMLGILIGPSGAGWVTSQGAIGFLGEFGLIFLFFQAGFEFNPGKIGAAPLRLGALAWLAALGLTSVFIGFLYLAGLVRAPLLVGIVLPTTAFGMLIPILRETDELDSNFGRYVLGTAAIGELGPLILAPLVLAQAHQHLHQNSIKHGFSGNRDRSYRFRKGPALGETVAHDRALDGRQLNSAGPNFDFNSPRGRLARQ